MNVDPRAEHPNADNEAGRIEAIRRRRESPERYIEYQMRTGRVMLERIRGFLPPRDARVLEIGCGPGGILMALAEGGMRAHGIDRQQYDSPLPAAHAYAVAHGIPVAFGRADASCLPYRDASFDCVVASSVIEHLDDPAGALREVARVLTPGGLAFVDFPLFRGPYGGHIDDVIPWPWFHLRGDAAVAAALEARGATFDLEVFRSLNHITHAAFRRHVRESGLGVVEFRRLHFLTHPGRKLLVGLLGAARRGSLGGVVRALRDAASEFTFVEALEFPLLLALVPISYLPGVEEWTATGVRYVLRRAGDDGSIPVHVAEAARAPRAAVAATRPVTAS